MLSLILAALVTLPAHASTKVISVETGTTRFANLIALNATCSPGIAENGHNFPTFSVVKLPIAFEILPNVNDYELAASDPHMDFGNHCAELLRELGALMPADVTMSRKITERKEFLSGKCVRSFDEELSAKIGSFDLIGGKSFIADILPDSDCR